MKVTDRVVYRTTFWTIETESDVYHVQCQEDEIYDTWHINSDEEGTIDVNSELGEQLKQVCEDYEEFDMDGNN